MINQKEIKKRNFTLFRTLGSDEKQITEYLAKRKSKLTKEYSKVAVLLEVSDEGIKITDYFNEPIRYREYYFIGDINNEEQFNKVLDDLKFTIEEIDLEQLTQNYV